MHIQITILKIQNKKTIKNNKNATTASIIYF